MTDLLSRPQPSLGVPAQPVPPRPAALSAGLGAGWATAVCLAGCLAVSVVAWLLGSTGTAPGALRTGAMAWLLAHGTTLALPTATVSVLPLGITAVSALLLYRSGRWAAASSAVAGRREVAIAAGTLAGCYAALCVVVALVATSALARPDPVRAFLGSAVLAAVCGGSGVLRGAGLLPQLSARAPEQLRAAVTGATAGVLAMLAASSLLLAVSLASHFTLAQQIAASVDAGPAGAVLLGLIGLLLLPNAALFAGAFILGPGFALGVHTMVTPAQVHLGRLPSLPLFAALPAEGPQPAWMAALTGVPLLVGCIAAGYALRRYPTAGVAARLVRGGLAGAATGAAVGLLTALAGATGPGRLSDVGPRVWLCALIATASMAIGGMLAGGASALLRGALPARLPDRMPWRRNTADGAGD